MIAAGKLQTVPFSLNEIDKIIPIIALCVDRIRADGLAKAVDFAALAKRASAVPPSEKPVVEKPSAPRLFDKSGTGFVVSPAGHVVTNHHVIEKCVGDIHVNLTGESPSVARVVSADEMNDLALLQAPSSFKEVATIRSAAVRSGDSIIAIGFPFHGLLTSDFTVTTGIVSSLSGLLNDTRFLQISAPIQPGNSGGPLLDTSGHVVGVVAEKLNSLRFANVTGNLPENISFAIKTGALRDFLDNSPVPYSTAESSKELKTTEIAGTARAYTMLISCTAKDTAKK
jgi:S1-C subfamily serine protease